MSKQATALLMGHDPTSGNSMRDWYDNAPMDQLLEEQLHRLPKGPLGLLEAPKVEVLDGVPQDAIEVLRAYLAGRCGVMELIAKAEAIRLRPAQAEEVLTP
jgi:hypothetical protein